MSTGRNFANRTHYHGDNLGFLRGMNSESVQLIATDPPFKKGRDFHATKNSQASGAKFQDRWSWQEDVHEEWMDSIQDDWPAVWQVIESANASHSSDMGAYLCWLGVRLMEMRRILTADGTIYVHLDDTALFHVKTLMDAIFGADNFRNSVIWTYSGGGIPRRDYPRKHDTILRYTKSDDYKFHVERKPYKENTQEVGIHSTLSGPDHEIDLERGTPLTDWWSDIPTVTGWSPQNTGYPTQKPLELYERIIRGASDPGDLVLDPFAGCATTIIAAERLERQWVGMDIWDGSRDMIIERLGKEGLINGGEHSDRLVSFGDLTFATSAPVRTDDNEIAAPRLDLKWERPKDPWERIPNRLVRALLLDAQRNAGGVICAGCGRELESEFMELDHILPRGDRGKNHILNRIMLCRPCNGRKSNRYTLTGLVQENRKTGWMHAEDRATAAQLRAAERAEAVRETFDTADYHALIERVAAGG